MARNVLLLNSVGNGGNAASGIDHIAALGKYSEHNFYYHNFVYDLKDDFDLSSFDAIVIAHNFWPMLLRPNQREKIAQAEAVRLLFLQDEYQYVREINAVMAELNINVMFTCVAEKDFDQFYPTELIPSLCDVQPVLTGYVPEYLTRLEVREGERREFDIGYRSRVSPYYLGLLGHEKQVIAERFQDIALQHGFTANISVHEEDRIYGQSWLRFLQSCRTQLGTPSGSSIVDKDGSIIEAENAYRIEHPHASFEDVWHKILKDHDGKLVIDTVSPRFFEYAATRTTMVMHEGYYGGILEPHRHFIPIKKDYSNISEVIDKIRDRDYCAKLAGTAHVDLISSRRFSAERFSQTFDAVLARHLPTRPRAASLNAASFYQKMADDHDQALAFSRQGARLMDTPTGRKLKSDEWRRWLLRRAPFLGSVLLRKGGDPLVNLTKGLAALELALKFPTFRRLAILWLTHGELRRAVPLERLLKDILLLAIMKAGQSGYAPWGPQFHLTLDRSEPGAVILVAHEGLLEDGDEHQQLAHQSLFAGECTRILWDHTSVHPLEKFANTIRFFWPIRGKLLVIRSSSDEYYHLTGLTIITSRMPKRVHEALEYALTPATKAEMKGLLRTFDRSAGKLR